MKTYILGKTVEFKDLADLKAKVAEIHEDLHYDWHVILGILKDILSVEILNKVSQLTVGQEFTIEVKTDPAGLPLSNFEVSVSPAELGTVTGNKMLTNAVGDLVLNIKVDGKEEVSDTMTVKVVAAPVLVTTINAANISGKVGDAGTITPEVLPANATDKSVTYTSKDATIATVAADGKWSLKKVGSTTIDIVSKSTPTIKKTITVTVAEAAPASGS